MSFSLVCCALNLTGTQASGANMYSARSTVNDSLYFLYVGLECSVGTSVRVGNLNTESDTLAADFAFCHGSAPPYKIINQSFEKH